MFHYFRGLYKLLKIKFKIDACYDVYYLQNMLNYFLQSERKIFTYNGKEKNIISVPWGRPWLISHLPQFSEKIYHQILKIQSSHYSQLSKKRVAVKKEPLVLQSKYNPECHYGKDAFFKYNQAAFLTYPGFISKTDKKIP